jgi:hypothetical protein
MSCFHYLSSSSSCFPSSYPLFLPNIATIPRIMMKRSLFQSSLYLSISKAAAGLIPYFLFFLVCAFHQIVYRIFLHQMQILQGMKCGFALESAEANLATLALYIKGLISCLILFTKSVYILYLIS